MDTRTIIIKNNNLRLLCGNYEFEKVPTKQLPISGFKCENFIRGKGRKYSCKVNARVKDSFVLKKLFGGHK